MPAPPTRTQRTWTRRTLLAAAAGGLAQRAFATQRNPPTVDWLGAVRGQEIYSESAYLDLVGDDGATGLIARIGRYPTLGRSWVWGHLFHGREVISFTSLDGTCSRQRTDLDGNSVVYASAAAGRSSLRIERVGSRGAPQVARVSGSFSGRRSRASGGRPAHGPGGSSFDLSAELYPGHPPAGSLAGRSEVLGSGAARFTLDGRERRLSARGHFHEQTQESPRFVQPFVYATLRGERFFCVAILSLRGPVGWAWIDDVGYRIEGFELPRPGPARRAVTLRAVAAQTGGPASLDLVLEEQHVYQLPIYDVWRRGTLVGGRFRGSAAHAARPVSGCVNDHLSDRLPYTKASTDRTPEGPR